MRDAVAGARPDLLEAVLAMVGDDPFERIDESTRFAQPAIFCASLAGWARVADRIERADRLRRPLARRAQRARGRGRARRARRAAPRRPARPSSWPSRARRAAAARCSRCSAPSPPRPRRSPRRTASRSPTTTRPARSSSRARPTTCAPRAGRRAPRACARSRSTSAGAFHSPQMAAAVEPFRAALREVPLHEPSAVVFSCASARPFVDPVNELADALVSPVRWRQTMAALDDAGARAYLDPGPGAVLAKLAPRCVPGARPLETARRGPAARRLTPSLPLNPNFDQGDTHMATTAEPSRRTSRQWSSSRSPASAPTPRR